MLGRRSLKNQLLPFVDEIQRLGNPKRATIMSGRMDDNGNPIVDDGNPIIENDQPAIRGNLNNNQQRSGNGAGEQPRNEQRHRPRNEEPKLHLMREYNMPQIQSAVSPIVLGDAGTSTT